MTKHLSICALVFSLGGQALAATALFTDIHHQYESIRALGMGDAFTAVANDSSALFYNPAAYSRFEESNLRLNLVDLTEASNDQTCQNLVNTIQSTTNVTTIINALQTFYGNQCGARVKLTEVSFASQNWGMAFVPADVTIDLQVNNQAAPSLNLRAFGDSTLAVALSRPIRNESWGLLSWGATIKGIQREYVSTQLNALDLAANSSAVNQALTTGSASSGFTADIDLGFLFTPYMPGAWDWLREAKPTFAVVGHNLLDYGFTSQPFKIGSTQYGTPEKLNRVFDLGTRFELPSFWVFHGRLALDERDLNHPQFDWRRGFHIGAEFDWALSSWWKGAWRAGMSEVFYPTFGFTGIFSIFRLDLATWANEVGTYVNPVPSRMYEVCLSMDI